MVIALHVRPAGLGRRSLSCVLLSGLLLGAGAVGLSPALAGYPSPPAATDLGTAAAFSVIGGSTVTNTGPSVLTGDLGVFPGTSITGFPPGTLTGAIHADDAVAQQAQSDTSTAYTTLAGRPSTNDLTGKDLAGLTLTPGVATFSTTAGLADDGVLTLDGQGDPDSEFVFQVGTALTTGSASKVQLINGAQACHAFWQVGSSATIGSGSAFTGNVLAYTSITGDTAASVQGSLLAMNGAVTLDSNTVSAATCAAAPAISVSETPSPASRPTPGGSFAYTVVVTNDGSTPVTLTDLSDDLYGDLAGKGNCATGGSLAAGASYTCTYSETYTGAGGTSRTDTVTAVGTDAVDQTATASDDATINITTGTGPGQTGILEICKRADDSAGKVTGTYAFAVAGRTVHVPVGTCTGPLTVPAGDVQVTEAATSGVRLSACNSRPTTGLRLCDPAHRTAVVHVRAGGVAKETVLSITNRQVTHAHLGGVKVCKVAGHGVAVGATFAFTVGGRSVHVPAGPAAQGGYCKILNGFDRDQPLTVTELGHSGTHVSALTVQPSARRVTSSTADRSATVHLATGLTVVTFTNSSLS